jgi:hypothetical protein
MSDPRTEVREDVIMAELTECTDLARNIILTSTKLERARREVIAMGGAVVPPWGKGAIFMFPYDPMELNFVTAPAHIKENHFIFALSDLRNVMDVLDSIPDTDRPHLQIYEYLQLADRLLASDSD